MKIDNRKLKEYREKSGFTQKEMAKKIGVSDISYQYYELGIRNPKENVVKRIEIILGTNICITDKDKVKSLLKNIVMDMQEVKSIINVDSVGEMKVNDIISVLEKIMKGDNE